MSGYPEWQQVHLLLGELVESARSIIPNEPFPSFASVFTATCLLVLTEPLHFMFAKVNKFLNKGPEWNVKKLPSHWIEKILLHPPVEDEAHHREVGWVLDILIDGLRTPHVSHLFHFHKVVETIITPEYRIWSTTGGVMSLSGYYRSVLLRVFINPAWTRFCSCFIDALLSMEARLSLLAVGS